MTKKTSKFIEGPFADLTNDVAFKWVFGKESNRDILTALLNELLPEPIISDITLFKENNLPHRKGLKKGVFDISCRTQDGAYIDVEVQVRPQEWFADRCLYYSTYNIQNQIQEGADDYTLKPVYVVSIDNFVRKHGPQWQGNVLTHYSLREDSSGERMTDSLHFSFVELPLFRKEWSEIDNDKEKFYFCFKRLHEKEKLPEDMFEGLFLKLAGQAKVLEMPEHIRNKYTRTMTTEIDKRAQLKYAREEGRAEGKAEVAKAMLAKGMAADIVSEVTGISPEHLKSL